MALLWIEATPALIRVRSGDGVCVGGWKKKVGFDLQQDGHWLACCSCPACPSCAVSKAFVQRHNGNAMFFGISHVACIKYHDMRMYKMQWYANVNQLV